MEVRQPKTTHHTSPKKKYLERNSDFDSLIDSKRLFWRTCYRKGQWRRTNSPQQGSKLEKKLRQTARSEPAHSERTLKKKMTGSE